MADHNPVFSHGAINRYLADDDVSPSSVWQSIGHLVRRSGSACLIFDDTVLDKRYSFKMELVRPHYSGNEHGVVKGIGVVNCLYVNMDANEHWIIDWRMYDPDGDGKNKLDHARDMLDDASPLKANDSGGKNPYNAVSSLDWFDDEM
ncbi:MAG: transposase, partial [Candidatus Methylumidiphilus sp.]